METHRKSLSLSCNSNCSTRTRRHRRLLSSPPNRDVTFAHSSSISLLASLHLNTISRLISLGNYLGAPLKIGFLSLPRLCLPFHVLHPWCFGADITTTSRVTRALNNQAVERICRPRNIHKAREENEKINKNLFVSKALMQSLARLHVFGSHRKAVILAFGGQCRGGRRNRNKHIVNEINMQIGLLSGIGALANWSSSFEGK